MGRESSAVGFADKTIGERCAVMRGVSAHLSIMTRIERANFTILEVRRAAAPDEVSVALDETIEEVRGITDVVDQESILEACQENVSEDVALAVDAQGFSLTAAFGGAVGQSQAIERQIVATRPEHRAERSPTIQRVVIRIGDDCVGAFLTSESDAVLRVHVHDFLVVTVANVNDDARIVDCGQGIHRALNRAEITAAVRRNDNVGRASGRVGGFGGELPGGRIVDSREGRADSIFKRA